MRVVTIILTGVLFSFFFFPFEFRFLPGINTKMMMAVIGLAIAGLQALTRKDGSVSKEFFVITIIAAVFSFICFYSVYYNNTNDYDYVTYIMSMWVWFFAAYAVCNIIARLHGTISVRLIFDYLIAISVFQCVIALVIDTVPAVKNVVDTYIDTNVVFMDKIQRLYGIGAALDVAGGKFSAVLLMIAVMISNYDTVRYNRKYVALYSFCFLLISVIGAMIARTTYLGTGMGLAYIVYRTGIWKYQIKYSDVKFWGILTGIMMVCVVACIYFYNNSPGFREWFRFGFEGFVSWVETGTWKTGSTEILQSMVRNPESLKTWIIGDGFVKDPITGSYYMITDIGYLRFIFYCGLLGLTAFTTLFLYLTSVCYKQFPVEKHLFLMLQVLVFAIWAKVSTDIFLVYAIFVCVLIVQRNLKRLTNSL